MPLGAEAAVIRSRRAAVGGGTVTYVNAGAGVAEAPGSSPSTLNVPYPATVTAGNLLILQFWRHCTSGGSPAPGIITPSGWDLLFSHEQLGVRDAIQGIFAKVATGAETGSQAVEHTGNTNNKIAMGRMYQISGQSESYIEDNDLQSAGSGSTYNAPSLTVGGSGRLCMAFLGIGDNQTVLEYTGETGGDWALQENYVTLTGDDGTLVLHVATLTGAGTISGGSSTSGGTLTHVTHGIAFR